jgi:hypothetical protein
LRLSSSGKNIIITSVVDNADTIIAVSDMTGEGVYEIKRLLDDYHLLGDDAVWLL